MTLITPVSNPMLNCSDGSPSTIVYIIFLALRTCSIYTQNRGCRTATSSIN
uniref:Uncharacterized protein n=1 Tax=Anguilla anguilla TaxID=7936 RepID=A0A0E9UI16_ANGAN